MDYDFDKLMDACTLGNLENVKKDISTSHKKMLLGQACPEIVKYLVETILNPDDTTNNAVDKNQGAIQTACFYKQFHLLKILEKR